MPKKILIVDDDKGLSHVLTSMLEADNYEVVKAYDGQEGLESAHREKPDLILLDLMLPKMDGYKVCRLLKFDMKYKDIRIILCSARAEESDKKMGEDVGADAYIVKPFKTAIILAKIKELLGEKP